MSPARRHQGKCEEAGVELRRRQRVPGLTRIVGPDVPILATLDLHTNISREMSDRADVLIAYLTNPHVDQRERAGEAARAMDEMFKGMKPQTAFVKVPIAAPSVVLLSSILVRRWLSFAMAMMWC